MTWNSAVGCIAFVLIMGSAFITALCAGAITSLTITLACSVAGTLIAASLDWSQTMIWCAQLAAPFLLLAGLSLERFSNYVALRGCPRIELSDRVDDDSKTVFKARMEAPCGTRPPGGSIVATNPDMKPI